jgi:ABC-type multidrug transport system permease subunit
MKPLFQTPTKHLERPRINPFTKLFYILEKNLKLLIRTKVSALIFILGPLIITALLAIAFNTSTLSDINIAVYSESYSPLTESIISNLTTQNHNLIKATSEPDCIDSARFGDFQACIIFPSNMELSNEANNIISIYVDNSRLNIANLIASQITTKVSVEASSLSEEIVTNILIVLDTANSESTKTQALVTDLISKNTELQASLTTSSSKLSLIDLSYNPIVNSTIDTDISTLESVCNATATITSLKEQIDDLETSNTNLITKLTTAQQEKDSVSGILTTIAADLTTQASTFESVQTNLVKITDNIATIEITNAGNIATPLRTNVETSSITNSFLLFILPTMLTIIIMFLSLLMSSSSIISEKESKAYFRNFITPTNGLLFLLGEFLSNLLVLSAQIVIMLGVLYFFLKDIITPDSFLLTGLSLLTIGIFFILLGMLLGYLFNTKQTVTLSAISTGILLLFFSNTIIPLETLSSKVREIISYNPFLLSENMLKKILIFNSTFSGIDQSLLILGIASIIILILAIISRSLSKSTFSA